MTRAHVVLIGCGGLGSEVGLGLIRKGIGRLTLFDHDNVELTNLPRQFFQPKDIGKNKAFALAENLRDQATGETDIRAYPLSFQVAKAKGISTECSLAVAGVDNNPTRVAVAESYLLQQTPAIFLAVDDQASKGYVFVQTSRLGDPCFMCLFPDARQDSRVHQCAGASIEILKIVAGMALYAIDSLLMSRARPWNYKAVFLDQGSDGQRNITMRSDCNLCAR